MKTMKPPTKRQITDELLELLREHLEDAGVKVDTTFAPPSGRAIRISAGEHYENDIGEITVDGYDIIFKAAGNRLSNMPTTVLTTSAYNPYGTQEIENAIFSVFRPHLKKNKTINNIVKWIEAKGWIAKPRITFEDYHIDVLLYDDDSIWHAGKIGRIRLFGNYRISAVASPENGQWGEPGFPVLWGSPPNNMIDVGFSKNKREIYNLFVAATWKKWR